MLVYVGGGARRLRRDRADRLAVDRGKGDGDRLAGASVRRRARRRLALGRRGPESRVWERVAGAAILAIVGAGVLWSDALAYRDVNLAPRDQLAELETIGHRIAGQGPTLMTEYQPYGVRHFLRDADPEGASELRRRHGAAARRRHAPQGGDAPTPIASGSAGSWSTAPSCSAAPPSQSRPPSPYRLTWRGDYYEVWQRPEGLESSVIDHLGLGTDRDPSAVPGAAAPCSGSPARPARAGRSPPPSAPRSRRSRCSETSHPTAWQWAGLPEQPAAGDPGDDPGAGPGAARRAATRSGSGARCGREVDLPVDGRPVGAGAAPAQQRGRVRAAGPGPARARDATRSRSASTAPTSTREAAEPRAPIGPLQLSAGDTAYDA